MKKLFTVLAVLLVASLAFAVTFSGNVKAQYTFNFDKKTIGYGAPGFGAVDAAFKWDTGTVTVGGESDTHIDFAASASFEGFYNISGDHDKGYDPAYKYGKRDGKTGVKYSAGTATIIFSGLDSYGTENYNAFRGLLKLSVDTFKIVGKDWEVNFLGSVGLNFAKSAIDSEEFHEYTIEDNTVAYSFDNSVKGNHNLAVTALGGYKFGFGIGTEVLKTNWNRRGTGDAGLKYDSLDSALNFALTATTPEYDFNGVKAKFGAGYQVADNAWTLAASAQASYAADKWSLGGAVDADLAKKAKEDEAFLRNEIAVNFGFAPVAVDLYWNNEGGKAKDKFYDYFADKTGLEVKYGKNYLSAKVVVDVAKVAENVPVTVTLTGKNLVNENKQNLAVEAETTIVPNFKFGAYFKDWFDQTTTGHRKLGATVEFTGVEKLTLNAEVAYKFAKLDENKKFMALVGASYAHELFTASAAIACDKVYDQEVLFAAKAAVVSKTLVEGAELSAKAYFNLNNSEILDEGSNATNKLALACKVSF